MEQTEYLILGRLCWRERRGGHLDELLEVTGRWL